MKGILDQVYKRSVVGYHNIAGDMRLNLDKDLGKHLAYTLLAEKAERLSEQNGTSFGSEYRTLKQNLIAYRRLEQKLESMERTNPSLSSRGSDDYKTGIDFKTNQPVYSLDKYFKDRAFRQANEKETELSFVDEALLIAVIGLLYLKFGRYAKSKTT